MLVHDAPSLIMTAWSHIAHKWKVNSSACAISVHKIYVASSWRSLHTDEPPSHLLYTNRAYALTSAQPVSFECFILKTLVAADPALVISCLVTYYTRIKLTLWRVYNQCLLILLSAAWSPLTHKWDFSPAHVSAVSLNQLIPIYPCLGCLVTSCTQIELNAPADVLIVSHVHMYPVAASITCVTNSI